MKVFTDIKDCSIKKPVLTLGSFDGVHLGHLKVISRLNEIAKETGGESVILTFSPHPRQVLYPKEHNIKLLSTMDEKIALLEKAGVDNIIFYPFTIEFSKLSYTEFVKDLLIGELGMKFLVVGYDHRFGSNREGDFTQLNELSKEFGFAIEKEEALNLQDVNISSTKIRNALAIGDIELVRSFLGYDYSLYGKVVPGQKLGRKIGFPTANIKIENADKLIPAVGVYAVNIEIEGEMFSGMLNMGMRPTVSNNGDFSVEVNIFNFDRDIYGKNIKVSFIGRIRGERKFEGLDELKTQLAKDKSASELIFSKMK
ncbi:MAG: bifunctional riboflavin kinase/FAD synthetase [Marinifilaceae bacterium]